MVEPIDRGLERPRCGEGADVQLVHQSSEQLSALPAVRVPAEARMVDKTRKSVDAVGLPRRPRIRQHLAAVQSKPVGGARIRVDAGAPPAAPIGRHRIALRIDLDVDLPRTGRPHAEGCRSHETLTAGTSNATELCCSKCSTVVSPASCSRPDNASTHSPPDGTASGSSTTVSRQPPARSSWAQNLVANTATSGERLNATR